MLKSETNLEGLALAFPSFITKIEKLKVYAKTYNVPIITDQGLDNLISIIKENKVSSILEIGSAIGYSSINMAYLTNTTITTIERDIKMFNEAKKNIEDFNMSGKIKIHFIDALLAYDLVKDNKYDMIFIDAAKGQYKNFFTLYENLLNENGIIVTDNLLFHGLVDSNEEIKSRQLRSLVRKIREFKVFLIENKNYETTFINVGDGLGVSKKL